MDFDFPVNLNSGEVRESHLPEGDQLVPEITPNFQDRRRSWNICQKALVKGGSGDSVFALIQLVEFGRVERVSLAVLAAEFSSPRLAFLCFGKSSGLRTVEHLKTSLFQS